MCTATYLPLAYDGYVLTHSRDEKTARPAALFPKSYAHKESTVLYPKDPQGQGTWIATSVETTVCLLNGAFVAHRPQLPYKHSRGLVPLHVFDYALIDDFLTHYSPAGLEPFTLLLVQMNPMLGRRLVEMRWTGHRMFVHEKDPDKPHIWSSATLYTPDVVDKRERWFREWLQQNPQPTVAGVRRFHGAAGDGDQQNAIRMNRNDRLMTLSLTSVVRHNQTVEMIYEDFVQPQLSCQTNP